MGAKAELGVCQGGGVQIGPKTKLLIYDIFTAILSLMEHVKTGNGRYLSNESFCLTTSLKKYILK
jgi:hypothetical protein